MQCRPTMVGALIDSIGSSFRLIAANRRCRLTTHCLRDVFAGERACSLQARPRGHCRQRWPISRDEQLYSLRAAVSSIALPVSAFCAVPTRRSATRTHRMLRDVIVTSRCAITTWCVDVMCGNIRMQLRRGILSPSLWCWSPLNGSVIHNKTSTVKDSTHKKISFACRLIGLQLIGNAVGAVASTLAHATVSEKSVNRYSNQRVET